MSFCRKYLEEATKHVVLLKGICSLPVSDIVAYTFYKCNEYFVSRWEKARQSLAKGERWRKTGRKYLLEQAEISNNEVVVLFDPPKLVYEVKSSSRTSVGGEVSGGHIFRVEIDTSMSCTCMIPTLLHLPCSYVITVYHMWCVLHEEVTICHRTTHYLPSWRHGSPDLSLCLTHRSGWSMTGCTMYRM
jgi:hypothetical protein